MQGWAVDVYERSTSVREIGAGIFIKWNALRVLQHFGLLDRIRSNGVVLREARTLDKDGELLQRRILSESNPVWNIQRQNLIRALLDRATALGAQVYTDAPVDAVSPDGTVSIRGQQHKAELVIAADGVNSVARRALGLDRKVRAPRSGAIRLTVPRTDDESADIVREFWSGRLRVGVSPCTTTEAFAYLIAPLRMNARPGADRRRLLGRPLSEAEVGEAVRARQPGRRHPPPLSSREHAFVVERLRRARR